MIDLASEYTSTPTANNATYQLYNPFEQRQDIIRIDWQATGNQRVHGRYLHDEYDLLDPYGVFSGAALPTVPTNRSRPGTSYQVGHTWVVRPTLVNEARISAAWNGQRINPQGDTWLRDTYGYQFPELYPGGFITDGIPSVSVSGFAALTSPSFALLSPTTDITFQDTLTYTRSTHSIRTGFAVSRNRKDQNGRAAYLGNVAFNPSGQPEQHEQRARGRAARQLPDLQRGVGRPGRVLPLHVVPGVRVGHVAVALEPEPGARSALRVFDADLRAGQQPRQFRSRRSTIRRRP